MEGEILVFKRMQCFLLASEDAVDLDIRLLGMYVSQVLIFGFQYRAALPK